MSWPVKRRRFLISGFCLLGMPAAAAQTPAFDAGFAEFRRTRGLQVTAPDARLVAVAAAIAADNDARGRLDHRDGQGRDLGERAAATRVAWRIVAENLAVGAASESEALDLWVASPPHRANLELPAITRHGLARARTYWALVVAG
ncbi:MAG: CAP domain-containing protein [Magnetospirillum sp.]|nr:CAP domain-containing protein [Magnetospirillum sp.]